MRETCDPVPLLSLFYLNITKNGLVLIDHKNEEVEVTKIDDFPEFTKCLCGGLGSIRSVRVAGCVARSVSPAHRDELILEGKDSGFVSDSANQNCSNQGFGRFLDGSYLWV